MRNSSLNVYAIILAKDLGKFVIKLKMQETIHDSLLHCVINKK